MRTLLLWLSVVLAVGLLANPTAVVTIISEAASFPMLSESVAVDFGPTEAVIDGSFTFGEISKPWPEHPCVAVWLPIIIREGSIDPNKTLAYSYEHDARVVVRVGRHESAGRPIHPRNPEYQQHPPMAHYDGLDFLWFKACSEFKRKQNTMSVCYKQQLIDGVFYYIPIIKSAPDSMSRNRSHLMKVRSKVPLYPAKGMACGYEKPTPLEMVITLTDGALVAITAEPTKSADSLPPVAK